MENLLSTTAVGSGPHNPSRVFRRDTAFSLWIPTAHNSIATALHGAQVQVEVSSDLQAWEIYSDFDGNQAKLNQVGKFLYIWVGGNSNFRTVISSAVSSTTIPAICISDFKRDPSSI